jgi:hypothetical protein
MKKNGKSASDVETNFDDFSKGHGFRDITVDKSEMKRYGDTLSIH